MERELLLSRRGVLEYGAGVALQEDLRARVSAGSLSEVLLLLEHSPVYTRGRRSTPDELPLGPAWYRERGIDVVDTDRGGRVTYHGPGQLIGYPIMRIPDVLVYLRTMERAIVAALADEDVEAHTRKGHRFTGVWVQDRKIASIGVHLSRGVSTHGFAVNVENDLEPFGWIVPCGLPEVEMTSLERETGRGGRFEAFRERIVERFCEAYGRTPREQPLLPAEPAPA